MDPEDQRAFGLIPGTDAEGPFADTFDPRDDFDPDARSNFGWIWETEQGIGMQRHPETVFLDRPALWDVLGMWRAGVLREISYDVIRQISNFELECVYALAGADAREERRRLGAIDQNDGEEGTSFNQS